MPGAAVRQRGGLGRGSWPFKAQSRERRGGQWAGGAARRCPAAGMKEDKENARPKERRGAAAGPGALLGAGTATGTDGRAGGAELDRLERPKDKKETLSKVGPARCSGWGPPARGNGASRRGPQGGGAGGTATLTVPPAAGGDPPAAAQPDKGAAGGAPAAPARARLLRVLRQRLQVRPPGPPGRFPQSRRCHRRPGPGGAAALSSALSVLCFCSLYPHMFSRAYINFKNQEDIVLFRDRFDGYVFVDHKGERAQPGCVVTFLLLCARCAR